MRLLIAIIASSLAVTAAHACPPPPTGYVPPTREEALRGDVERAQAIVYAVVETSIGAGERDFATGEFSGRAGIVRVIHVYKGDLRPGQRIPMYGLSYDTDCGSLQYAPATGRFGAYGVLFLHHPVEGRLPLPFSGFRPEADVAEMIRLGLIGSARSGGN
jgi:hypothetical protein